MSQRGAPPLIERRLVPIGGPGFGIAIALAAIATGLLLGGLLFIPFDSSPVDGYSTLFREGFGTSRGLGDTLVRAAPLIFIGLGTIVTWRAGFFFLGFQGCLLMGATGAALVALAAADGRPLDWAPTAVLIPLTLVAAAATAGIWSGIVGYLKARHDGNEVLLSLMMNFVAAFLLNYLVSGPMRAKGALPQTERFDESAHLPLLLGQSNNLHFGVIVAVLLVAVVAGVFHLTALGFDLSAMGHNARAAHYGGIDIAKRTIQASVLGGGSRRLRGMVSGARRPIPLARRPRHDHRIRGHRGRSAWRVDTGRNGCVVVPAGWPVCWSSGHAAPVGNPRVDGSSHPGPDRPSHSRQRAAALLQDQPAGRVGGRHGRFRRRWPRRAAGHALHAG